jgi:ComF family protein
MRQIVFKKMVLFDDLISLFYPRLCAGCNIPLVRGEEVICLSCLADLPRTNYHFNNENPVFQIFIGRANISQATSFCRFDKGGRLQHLLHQLKYKGNREVGRKMGILFGYDLIQSVLYQDIEAIIPVPLHHEKEKKRGFNQSVEICNGLSESMHCPVILRNLIREVHTSSQTRKGRFERWENVSGIFSIKNAALLTGKHILLVDDVVTTGATLEACCEALLRVPGVKVSIATLACA